MGIAHGIGASVERKEDDRFLARPRPLRRRSHKRGFAGDWRLCAARSRTPASGASSSRAGSEDPCVHDARRSCRRWDPSSPIRQPSPASNPRRRHPLAHGQGAPRRRGRRRLPRRHARRKRRIWPSRWSWIWEELPVAHDMIDGPRIRTPRACMTIGPTMWCLEIARRGRHREPKEPRGDDGSAAAAHGASMHVAAWRAAAFWRNGIRASNNLTLHTSTQMPHIIRNGLSEVLKLAAGSDPRRSRPTSAAASATKACPAARGDRGGLAFPQARPP